MPAILEPAIQGLFSAVGVLLGVGYQSRIGKRQSVMHETLTEMNLLVGEFQKLIGIPSQTITYNASNPFWISQARVKGGLRLIATLNRSRMCNKSAISNAAEDCISEVSLLEAIYKSGYPMDIQRQKVIDSFNEIYKVVFPPSKRQKEKVNAAMLELQKYNGSLKP